MSDFFFDYKQLLEMKIESEMMKNKQVAPLFKLLKRYGIEGFEAMTFVAELATVCDQMKPENNE